MVENDFLVCRKVGVILQRFFNSTVVETTNHSQIKDGLKQGYVCKMKHAWHPWWCRTLFITFLSVSISLLHVGTHTSPSLKKGYKIVVLNPTISTITLNIDNLYILIKRDYQSELKELYKNVVRRSIHNSKNWEKSKCPSTGEQINKLICSCPSATVF